MNVGLILVKIKFFFIKIHLRGKRQETNALSYPLCTLDQVLG